MNSSHGITPIVFVDLNATGTANGTSWENAFTDLELAVATAENVEIWVADGTYRTSETLDINSGVSLYGGFEGFGGAEETLLSQRDVLANETVIDGNDHAVATNRFNSSATMNTRIDGFTLFINPNQNSSVIFYGGATGNVVANCLLRDTLNGILVQSGGGLRVENTVFANIERQAVNDNDFSNAEYIEVVNCTIFNCRSGVDTANTNTTIINTLFKDCSFAAIREYNADSDPIVQNCFFDNIDTFLRDENTTDITSLEVLNAIPGFAGNLAGDSMLTDPENGDFHLLSDSPCIDAGRLVSGLMFDLEGDLRGTQGAPESRGDGLFFDIGADEFIPRARAGVLWQNYR